MGWFGWNRDHLLQTCLNHDHGCDWILKMDCDEYLEVDDDFDWSLIDDTNIQSFHITAENPDALTIVPGCGMHVFHGTLSMMSHMNVLFVILMELVKTSSVLIFREVSVKWELGMEKAYATPTKYISDSLKLEEQHIREETLLSDISFLVCCKSYLDASYSPVFPLGYEQKEYARRAIF